MPTSFQVKNNGEYPVIIRWATDVAPEGVELAPRETSASFTTSAQYHIHLPFEPSPHTEESQPQPQVLVTFAAGKQFEAKALYRPSVNVDVIARFDTHNVEAQ